MPDQRRERTGRSGGSEGKPSSPSGSPRPPRAGPKGRPGASGSAGSTRSGGSAAGGTPRGSARPPRTREEIKRSTVRAGISLVVVAALFGGLYWYGTKPLALSAEAKALDARAVADARAASCSAVRVVAPYPGAGLDRAHVGSQVPSLPPLSSYPSVPPASGPHVSTPLDAGVYASAPPIGNAIHSLEHAAAIIWYAPADRPAARALAAFFALPANSDHVIVAPYDYPSQGSAGQLPSGVGMALVAWHRMQTCRVPSLPVAVDFVRRFAAPSRVFPLGKPRGYEGEAPEAGLGI